MINIIKLHKNGYTVKYSDGRNHSINGVLAESEDEEVQEWLLTNTPEPEFTAEELELQASTEYQKLRKAEYDKLNQFELIAEDAINGTTIYKDTIANIKAMYPKPVGV